MSRRRRQPAPDDRVLLDATAAGEAVMARTDSCLIGHGTGSELEAPALRDPRGRVTWPAPVTHQARALSRERPNLWKESHRAPVRVHIVSRADGERYIDLAREAMVTRERSLEAFSFADARDAWLVDDGDGLAFAFTGVPFGKK